ncbi:DUF3261 domain-containing protein [Duganella sp. Root1480D1]|uniref:DUF3261 domain-containing protein n=1 Tax=Duganella sp. Root1480D1 TaxID=1736471 RepID=UPI00070C620B|nr:DUF3261 domain-containing protein [Duganella sp. Root1480D1]KQZ28167.1 hypothetical protein ASD58_12055 [Duganella sp. Root1480D1]
MFNAMPRLAVAACALLLAACAATPQQPPARLGLKLAPAALGTSLSVQQHLKVERNGRTDDLDVALQVEPEAVDVVGLAFGQRVLSLHYDGKALSSWRHVMLPAQVRAEDVLEDIQLTLWPADAVAAALPAGWRVAEQGRLRTLYLDEAPVMQITYSDAQRWNGTVVLENLRYHYKLTIQFAANAD